MREISSQEAQRMGIKCIHHEMDNDEKRFRLVNEKGSSYILTISSNQSTWQKSHYHLHKKEFYVIEKGKAWLILWDRINPIQLIKLNENDSYFVKEGIIHNLFIEKNTIMHTIKFGCQDDDWNACEELDEIIKEKNDLF
ncbi:MAG: hypothetical protein ACI4U3_02910 [Traorella sp.]